MLMEYGDKRQATSYCNRQFPSPHLTESSHGTAGSLVLLYDDSLTGDPPPSLPTATHHEAPHPDRHHGPPRPSDINHRRIHHTSRLVR